MDQRDLIQALLLLAQKGKAGEIYNISSEVVYEMREIIDYIEEAMGKTFRIEVDKALLRPTDEKIIVGDIKKLQKDTGWKQSISMKQTIQDMLSYWRSKQS